MSDKDAVPNRGGIFSACRQTTQITPLAEAADALECLHEEADISDSQT